MRIRDIMSKPVITCSPIDSLDQAARLMWEFDCGAVPVVDTDGTVAGIVTDRDACMAAYTQGKSLKDIAVSEAMARQVFCCRPDDALEAVERLMESKQIRRLPVVDAEKRPVGLVTLGDIARCTRHHDDGDEGEVVRILSAISRPRRRELRTAPVAPPRKAAVRRVAPEPAIPEPVHAA
jgi:CBS domain-containing protein